MKMRRAVPIFGVLLLVLAMISAIPAEAKVTRYLTGNAGDVSPVLAGPAHDFGGGSTDVDAALQWIIDQVRGCTSCSTQGDVVSLRSTAVREAPTSTRPSSGSSTRSAAARAARPRSTWSSCAPPARTDTTTTSMP